MIHASLFSPKSVQPRKYPMTALGFRSARCVTSTVVFTYSHPSRRSDFHLGGQRQVSCSPLIRTIFSCKGLNTLNLFFVTQEVQNRQSRGERLSPNVTRVPGSLSPSPQPPLAHICFFTSQGGWLVYHWQTEGKG